MNNIGQYSKAFVPLIVMFFAMIGERFGINFGIGEVQAEVLLGLLISWLVFLIPNTKTQSVEAPTVVVQTPVVPIETPAQITEVKPSIIRTVTK